MEDLFMRERHARAILEAWWQGGLASMVFEKDQTIAVLLPRWWADLERAETAQRQRLEAACAAAAACLAVQSEEWDRRGALAAEHNRIVTAAAMEMAARLQWWREWEEQFELLEAEELVFRSSLWCLAEDLKTSGRFGLRGAELRRRGALFREWRTGWAQIQLEMKVATVIELAAALELLEADELVSRVSLMALWQQLACLKWADLQKKQVVLQQRPAASFSRSAPSPVQCTASEPVLLFRWLSQIPEVPLVRILCSTGEAFRAKRSSLLIGEPAAPKEALMCCRGHPMPSLDGSYQCVVCGSCFCSACAANPLPEYGLPNGAMAIVCDLCCD